LTTKTNLETQWRELVRHLASLLGMSDQRCFDDARFDAGAAARPDDAVERRPYPVLRHFGHALALDASVPAVCAVLVQFQSRLRWQQNPNYVGADFVSGYAYCELVGPAGSLRHPDIALGLLLLGPRVTYPEHAHPAAEVYAVVAGCAQWRQGDRLWRRRAPGERIHHASNEPHAMRTADEPLLAAYLWQDHLDQGARLLEGSAS
jgi:hypothetical protein